MLELGIVDRIVEFCIRWVTSGVRNSC